MQVVGERRLPDDAPPQPSLQTMMNQATTTTANMQAEYVARAAWKHGVLASINVLVLILSARLIMLISVMGGIALTWLVLQRADTFQLIALAVYCVGVVFPALWLAVSGRT
jgi:hypothetical protein